MCYAAIPWCRYLHTLGYSKLLLIWVILILICINSKLVLGCSFKRNQLSLINRSIENHRCTWNPTIFNIIHWVAGLLSCWIAGMNDQVPDVPCIIFQHNFLQKLFQLISLSFYKLYKNRHHILCNKRKCWNRLIVRSWHPLVKYFQAWFPAWMTIWARKHFSLSRF